MSAAGAIHLDRDKQGAGTARGQIALALLFSLAIVAAAIAQQISLGLNPDTSWLIIVSERMLGGDQLYRDVFELNPPASVLLTLPPVALAEWLGWRAEAVLAGSMIALSVASVVFTIRLLRPWVGEGALAAWLFPAGLFLTLLLPGFNFAQREHYALLAVLPWLALMSLRAEMLPASRRSAVLAGIGAGVTAVIKPHFLLVLLLPLLAASWRQRSPKVLWAPECVAVSSVVGAYLLVTLLVFPAFWTMAVPLAADGYLQNRLPLSILLSSITMLLAAAALVASAVIGGRAMLRGPALMFALGSLSFGVAVIVQAKGFSNHQYPVLALALATFGLAAALRPVGRDRRLSLLLCAAAAGLGALQSAHMYLYPEVAALIRRTARERPSMIMAGSNLTMAHPLTRWVDGRWVGTRASLWVTHAAVLSLEQAVEPGKAARLKRRIAEDKAIWLSDVQKHRPDVILVAEGEGDLWIARNPDVQHALSPYRSAGSAQGLTVLVRCLNARGAAPRGASGPPAPGC